MSGRLEDIGAGRLAEMDKSGVDAAVLSLTSPERWGMPIYIHPGIAPRAAVALHFDGFEPMLSTGLATGGESGEAEADGPPVAWAGDPLLGFR